MKNITVSVDEEVARWARVWAAENDTSVSRMLGSYLEERMLAEKGYQSAMQSFLSKKPRPLREKRTRYPKRSSLHER